MALTIGSWRDFYMMAGGAIAAMTGLLFVAMSIHLSDILNKPGLMRNVSVAMYGMLFQLVFCGFMLLPGVTIFEVGIAVTAGGLVFAAAYLRFANPRNMSDRVANSSMGFLAAGIGLALIAGWSWALYLYAGVLGVSVVALVRLCWRLLTMAMTGLRPAVTPVREYPRAGAG